jgi:hypothetical protein
MEGFRSGVCQAEIVDRLDGETSTRRFDLILISLAKKGGETHLTQGNWRNFLLIARILWSRLRARAVTADENFRRASCFCFRGEEEHGAVVTLANACTRGALTTGF